MKNIKHLLALFFIVLYPQSFFSQDSTKIEKKYYQNVIYRKVPNKKVFKVITSNDKKLQQESLERINASKSKLPDSILKKYNISEINNKYKRHEYLNNRSRIYFNPNRKKGISLPCKCFIKNDTLTIGSAIRFFGGYGLVSQLYKDKFKNYFIEYSDDDNLKLKKEDSIFKRSIHIDGAYQKLILENKPQIGETLTGYFSILTNPYYRYNKKNKAFGEVYFKCLVLKEPSLIKNK
ncbi:hypothetical protein DIS18_14035 [Algibacter marinivivus]|uniref:Uncharacterized protein n=1 Tax=Algibacter marinivivus TaxID=2100723 RepID=A0A2U2X1Y3_9FLAO|nr:hypothetical protein [Algibacter marinivivus]PWH81793.1 hypothetical protein DIS18_14035 [Algibacter marinivivus]